jgi:hypothetical protein
VIVGWFTRLLVVFAVIGVVGFDGITLVSAHLGAQEDANDAASDAAAAWQSTHGTPAALTAAETAAEERLTHGETLVPGSFQIAANGTVSLAIHRTAEHTLIAHDIGPLRHLISFQTTASVAPATS